MELGRVIARTKRISRIINKEGTKNLVTFSIPLVTPLITTKATNEIAIK